MMRPLKAQISLAAIANNFDVLRQRVPNSRVMAVLKANAYGHGTAQVAEKLSGADAFAVISIDEAVLLRYAGITRPIVLLEGFFAPREIFDISRHDLTPVLHCMEQIEALEQARLSRPLSVIVKINTGMNRLGFRADQFDAVIQRLESCDAVGEIMLMTHFASADVPDGVEAQLQCFNTITQGTKYQCCLANSAATLLYPETHRDCVRVGIALYGSSPFSSESARNLGLQPAMRLTSEIIGIQQLSVGERLGYGGSYVADKPTRVGVVAGGYADGYPRHAGTGTPVAIDGIRSRLLGRVSMDMLCVDLSEIENPYVGMPVELWGETVSVDEVAHAAGTIGYELLSGLTKRVPLIYNDHPDPNVEPEPACIKRQRATCQ